MTPLTPEEEETIRTAGVAWCDEVTFERVWVTVDRLRATQAVHETWREIGSVAGLALWRCPDTCWATNLWWLP